MKHASSLFFIIVIIGIGLLLSFQSCTSAKLTYRLQKLDTLQKTMESLQSVPLLDVDYLSLRSDSITTRLKRILKQLPDSGNVDLRFAINRYAAIRRNYEEVLKNYPVLTFDLDQEKSDLQIFKKDIIENRLSDIEFEARFLTEKAHLADIQKRIHDLNYSVSAIENDYRRNSEVLVPIYQKIISGK